MTRNCHRLAVRAGVLVLALGAPALAQAPLRVASLHVPQASEAATRSALPATIAGGAVGSLVGMLAVGAVSNCGVEDLGCTILTIGAGGVAGALGATLGTLGAAHLMDARSSALGAGAGAVVGTGVAFGIHLLLNQGTDRNLDDAKFIVPLFALSQGLFAALGSDLVARRQAR